MMASAIALKDVQFSYRAGKRILDIPHLEIETGERVFLFGPSGSGKTTLLGLLTGVLTAQQGSVSILGRDLARMSGSQRDAFRGSHLGYIFQLFNLIPYLSVLENITLPCRLHAERRRRLKGSLEDEARAIAKRLGIEALLTENVVNLSVGQQQRVAAARSLMGAPELIVADEPTSSLDFDHRERFIELLFDCVAQANATLLFVSHDRSLMPMFSRTLSLPEVNRIQVAAA
jgi:putative ABC transport system ATP-binding protein